MVYMFAILPRKLYYVIFILGYHINNFLELSRFFNKIFHKNLFIGILVIALQHTWSNGESYDQVIWYKWNKRYC